MLPPGVRWARTAQSIYPRAARWPVTGSVSVSTYTGNDGNTRASLEVTADDVEFLSPRSEGGEAPAPRPQAAAPAAPQSNGFVQVDDDELPF